MTDTTVPRSVKFDAETETRLIAVANASGKPVAHLIRQAVTDKLEDLEDLYFSLRSQEKGGKAWTWEELAEEYGVLDSDLET